MTEDKKIDLAATMAGNWWAERLAGQYADKKAAFSAAVAKLVGQALRGEIKWITKCEERPADKNGAAYQVYYKVQAPGDGEPLRGMYIEFDYDPDALLCDALQEAIGEDLKTWDLKNTLPRKHELYIDMEKMLLEPKEGYGNWTAKTPMVKPS